MQKNESIEQFMQAYQSGDKVAARDHIRDALAVAVNERLDVMRAEVADDVYNKKNDSE